MKIKHIICALALATSLVAAEPVAQVEKMYGQENLFRQQTETAQWYRSFLEQNASIGNHFKTDKGSWANIRFFLGGKLSLGKDCEVEIVSEREGEVVREAIHLKKGTFWAKFDKQKTHPVKIRTAGGVMGIRGTEFVVQLLPDGSTKLSLLEGDVGSKPTEAAPELVRGMKSSSARALPPPKAASLNPFYGNASKMISAPCTMNSWVPSTTWDTRFSRPTFPGVRPL